MSHNVETRRKRRTVSPAPFRSTARMRRYAAACCDPSVGDHDPDRCAAAKVSTRALANWRRMPDFNDWLATEMRAMRTQQAAAVWNNLLYQARCDNLRAAKLFVERFDAADPEADIADSGPKSFYELALLAQTEPNYTDQVSDSSSDDSMPVVSQPAAPKEDKPLDAP